MCDTLALVGDDGLLFAKNSDRPPDEPQVVEFHPRRAAGGTLRTQYLELPDEGAFAFVGSRPVWLWGVEHGVNDQGVAIGNEKLYTTGRPHDREPALLGMDLVRLGLEQGRNADHAVEVMTRLIERYGQGGSGEEHTFTPYDSSFLVADAHGGWIIETCDRTWVARPVGPGGAISNRITISTDWTRASADVTPGTDFQTFRHPRTPTGIADHRLAATRACVARGAGRVTPEDLMAVLRDHGTGPWGAPGTAAVVPPPAAVGDDHRGVTVCMHVRGHQATTASMIVAVARDTTPRVRLWALLGNPCVSVYVPLHLDDPQAGALGRVETWQRFARLRDRVDREPGALDEIRRVLAPVEARFLADGTNVDGALDGTLDAALASLGV